MSNTSPDRPAILKRAPKPAADEKVDPIDYTPAPAVSAPETKPVAPVSTPDVPPAAESITMPSAGTRPAGRSRREVTVPFSTRLAPDVITILDELSARGYTQRAAVENALREYWIKMR